MEDVMGEGCPVVAELLTEKKMKLLSDRIQSAGSNVDALKSEMAQYLSPSYPRADNQQARLNEKSAPEQSPSPLCNTLSSLVTDVEGIISGIMEIRERLR
jgi:hypothetical protein